MSWSRNLLANMIESVQNLLAHEVADPASGNTSRETSPSRQQYPRTTEDVYRTTRYLNKASKSSLPAELLKIILYHADYDCIHFRARSSQTVTAASIGNIETPRLPYVETRPLKYVSPTSASGGTLGHGGRLRAVRLQVTGRDQGWGGDSSGSWSWFEVARTPPPTIGTVQTYSSEMRMKWAENEVASKAWQQHEANTESNEHLRAWASSLRNGDRVSITPVARFPGWQCNASSGSIDIEVEVWRL